MKIDNVDRARVEPPRLPSETAAEDLSDIAVWLVAGAHVERDYCFNKKIVRVALNEREVKLHTTDFELAYAASEHVRDQIKQQGIVSGFISASVPCTLEVRRSALRYISVKLEKEQSGARQVIMLPADASGCGLWRIRLPGAWMRDNCKRGLTVNISDLSLDFDDLMKYDVIVVQRVIDYDQWRTLGALKRAGKKIVYEIDDDLFRVETDNPSYKVYSRADTQYTARSCIELADVVVVTTPELAEALKVTDKMFVYPNSIDPDCFSPLRERDNSKQRLFWAGSNTHNEDFRLITKSLITLLKERANLELVIMGAMPYTLSEALDDTDEEVSKRVSMTPFMRSEIYLRSLMGGINADVGLVPLRDSVFNRSKSTVKVLEYTIAGLPVVASNVPPYNIAYTHNENIMLCSTKNDWVKAINILLDKPEIGGRLVEAARAHARSNFNINIEAARFASMLTELAAR